MGSPSIGLEDEYIIIQVKGTFAQVVYVREISLVKSHTKVCAPFFRRLKAKTYRIRIRLL